MNIITKTVAAIIALFGMTTGSLASTLQEIEKASFLLADGVKTNCSSTYIGKDKTGHPLFLTGAHCVDSLGNYNVRRQYFSEDMDILKEEIFYVDVAAMIKEKDVAVLRGKMPYEFGIDGVDILSPVEYGVYGHTGADVLVAGFPLTQSFTFSTGLLVGKNKEASSALGLEGPLIRTTANVAPGSSGGGLYMKVDGEYFLIGTTVAMNGQYQFMTYFSTPESVDEVIGVVID